MTIAVRYMTDRVVQPPIGSTVAERIADHRGDRNAAIVALVHG